MLWGQLANAHYSAIPSPHSENGPGDRKKKDTDSCYVRRVKTLPGSHSFAADFIEAIATDPSPRVKSRNVIWALTADLSDEIPAEERALYISKSTNGGETWTQVVKLDSRYFDAGIDEGLRNGLSVAPGGAEFVVTTQRGAFQILRARGSDALVRYIEGPHVQHDRPWVSITKKEGDPVRAAAAKMTADGRRLMVGYGYFDMNPQIVTYHRGRNGSWVEEGPLPEIPTDLDILSMQWDQAERPRPGSLYVGTGDQVFRLNLRTMKWTGVKGVEPDSAIHAINTVGGLHIAACWGIYEPVSADVVTRVTDEVFVYHRDEDETGSNVRAYGIEVDPANPKWQVVTALTGVYITRDAGQNWRRMIGLPGGEYRTAHINADGGVIVSGIPGTFLANPFSSGCGPRLRKRDDSDQ
ncbi:hypothetical protein [Alloacidobacterium sp.]|uniref:hypothetical protein n=1 Tax=Alloacidobacterium sp. TaxID=2951999 RepID=UPI002D378C6C|nr:hypothetical protein [Alloacidobacterium sp.]HYK37855.1 hypothetical protein [Alloacidobacterium sp.]